MSPRSPTRATSSTHDCGPRAERRRVRPRTEPAVLFLPAVGISTECGRVPTPRNNSPRYRTVAASSLQNKELTSRYVLSKSKQLHYLPDMDDNPQRVALITGAGRGIGSATAVALGHRGFHVIVNYHRDADTAGEVARAVRAAGGSALPFRADIRDPEQVTDMVAAVGPIDALVCNANIAPPFASFESMPWETFIGKVDGELAAAYHITRSVLPGMRERRDGRIVYVSSLSADLTRPGAIAHATAKAALNTFARYVAAEAGSHGIAVNVVAPAAVRTEGSAAARTPELERSAAQRSVLGRMVEADDVAAVIVSLLDTGFTAVTGAHIPVDAGFRVLTPP